MLGAAAVVVQQPAVVGGRDAGEGGVSVRAEDWVIGFRWIEGCRAEVEEEVGVAEARIDGVAIGDEPSAGSIDGDADEKIRGARVSEVHAESGDALSGVVSSPSGLVESDQS